MPLTGEEADVASGLVEASSISTETAIQAREQINNLMEKLVNVISFYDCDEFTILSVMQVTPWF